MGHKWCGRDTDLALATYWLGFGKSLPPAVPYTDTRGRTDPDPIPGLSGPGLTQTEQASGTAPSSTCAPLTRTSRALKPHLGLGRSRGCWWQKSICICHSLYPQCPSSGAELCMASSRLLLSGIALATGSSPTISTAARPSFPIPHPLIYLSQTFIFPRHSLQLLSCSETQRLWPILCIKLGWKVGARPKKANIRAGREQVWKGSVEF